MSATAVSTATGRFVWRDLMSTDPEKSEAFFTALFGWTIDPTEMDGKTYRMFKNGDKHLGGVMPLEQSGIPSHWISYINVPNLDEANAKIAELGGQIHMPGMDVPGMGRFAVAADPTGAALSIWEDAPGTDSPEDRPPGTYPPLGGVSWNELATADVDVALNFYKAIFGYDVTSQDMGGGMIYHVLNRGEYQEGGLHQKMPHQPVSAWTIYFHVADVDAALAEVSRLGGQPIGEVMELPDIGRLGWATDPTGAFFALHEAPK